MGSDAFFFFSHGLVKHNHLRDTKDSPITEYTLGPQQKKSPIINHVWGLMEAWLRLLISVILRVDSFSSLPVKKKKSSPPE